MTGREVHMLASQLLGGACLGAKDKRGSTQAGTGLTGRRTRHACQTCPRKLDE
jgi:hypothetical protein